MDSSARMKLEILTVRIELLRWLRYQNKHDVLLAGRQVETILWDCAAYEMTTSPRRLLKATEELRNAR